MKNSTRTNIIIKMDNVDQANKLSAFLKKSMAIAEQGGDFHLICRGANSIDSLIGHDVRALKVSHNLVNTAQKNKVIKIITDLLDFGLRNICTHEETHRGGCIWEICDHCGARWADDRGGKPKFVMPKEIVAGEEYLNKIKT